MMPRFTRLAMVCALAVFALPRPGTGADSPPLSTEHESVLEPNKDGVVDLSIRVPSEESDPLPNPFRIRFHPPVPVHEVPVTIGLVLLGTLPRDASVVINDQSYRVGDSFEGFTVSVISAEFIEMRKSGSALRLPIQERALTLRLAR